MADTNGWEESAKRAHRTTKLVFAGLLLSTLAQQITIAIKSATIARLNHELDACAAEQESKR